MPTILKGSPLSPKAKGREAFRDSLIRMGCLPGGDAAIMFSVHSAQPAHLLLCYCEPWPAMEVEGAAAGPLLGEGKT